MLAGISFSSFALATAPLDPSRVSDPIKTGAVDLIVPIPGGDTKVPSDPAAYLKLIFLYGIGLAALLAFAQLAFGAVQYTASAGFPALQESSKSRMRDAVIGLILLISAVSILLMVYRPGQRELESLPSALTGDARTKEIANVEQKIRLANIELNGAKNILEIQKTQTARLTELNARIKDGIERRIAASEAIITAMTTAISADQQIINLSTDAAARAAATQRIAQATELRTGAEADLAKAKAELAAFPAEAAARLTNNQKDIEDQEKNIQTIQENITQLNAQLADLKSS